MEILELHNINKFFWHDKNRVHVLKNINLSIEKGDFVAIIGQSGSGKSTLMNIIGCLDTPTSGSYKINKTEVGKMSRNQLAELRCKTFGFIFQRYNLLSSLNARENAALPAIYLGMGEEERNSRAVELLKKLELPTKLGNKPNELSGGQQQRVSIARALMNGGEIILADEPTGALDSKSGEMVMEIIKNLHKQGHTIILVTHDSKIAAQASRIIEIKDGEIVADERKASEFYEIENSVPEVKKSKLDIFKYRFAESFSMSIHAILANKARSTFDVPFVMGSLSVDLPFLDWTRVKNNIKISEADYQIAFIDFNDTLNQAVNEVGYYYFAYEKSTQSFDNINENYQNSTEITQYYKERYNNGKIEFRDYLQALYSENSLRKSLIQQKYQIIKYENYIYKAMAGRY